jgi:hypothetical protein
VSQIGNRSAGPGRGPRRDDDSARQRSLRGELQLSKQRRSRRHRTRCSRSPGSVAAVPTCRGGPDPAG